MDGSVDEPGWSEIARFARDLETQEDVLGGGPTTAFSSWIISRSLPSDTEHLQSALLAEHRRWLQIGGRPDEMAMSYLKSLYAALQSSAAEEPDRGGE